MYQKEIIYLGLYKDGERLGSAGFLKVEKRDKDGNLSLVVKNVPHSINGKYPVRYYCGSDWKEEDGITVREGGGQWEKQEPDSLEGVRLQIMLPGGYLVEGASREAVRQEPAPKAEKESGEPKRDLREQPVTGETVASMPEHSAAAEPAVSRQEQSVTAEPAAPVAERFTVAEPAASVTERFTAAEPVAPVTERFTAAEPAAPVTERFIVAEPAVSLAERSSAETGAFRWEQPVAVEPAVPQEPQKIKRIVVQRQGGRENGTTSGQRQKPLMADALVIEGLKEDKWEQILDTYDNIHPYGDERVYVQLEPKDFIILSGKYQHLVNNSFLLHGFYNYRHVILGKEGETYYLGVPGVFYEREKMVALMFGFEAFECESGESKAGEFGYYLRKVEL